MIKKISGFFLGLLAILLVFGPSGVVLGQTSSTPVTSFTLRQTVFQVGSEVRLNEIADVLPVANPPRTITWTLGTNHPAPAAPAPTLINGVLTSQHEGNVQVRARIEGGLVGGGTLERFFVISFSNVSINVSHNLGILYEGVPVNGNVLFTLEGNVPTFPAPPAQPEWQFAHTIIASDFFVRGLPLGLTAGSATRVYVNQQYQIVNIPPTGPVPDSLRSAISIPITGTPTTAGNWPVTVPTQVQARNIRFATFNVPVQIVQGNAAITVETSPRISIDAFTFDLNPHGEMHRDVLIVIDLRGRALSNVRFGAHVLNQNADFFRFDNGILLSTTFLSRMIVGTWDVTFTIAGGAANPVVQVTVIDSRVQQVLPPVMPPVHPGDFPTPPITPHHPDTTFIHLSGGRFVDIMNLNFAQDRARVAPLLIHGEATTTIRADIFEEMARRLPGQRFEISTPLTRLFIPTDFFDIIHGARDAISASRLGTHQVDVRIRQIDRSNDQTLINRFNNIYPGGLILSPLSDLRVELVNSATGAVIFTASEFLRPLETIHAVLQPGAHLRPAGMFFHGQRIEFAPFRTFSPNEISIISRFTGVHGIMQNATFFIDVPPSHWAFENAWTATYVGLVTMGGTFSTQTQISRGEFAQMLAYALQLPRAGISSSGFSDVPNSHPMFDGISRLNAAGLLWLWDGGLFHPNAAITREEMAAITASAVVIGNPIREPIVRPLNIVYRDGNQVSTHLIPAVQTALNYQLFGGYPDGRLRPQAPAVRIYATRFSINAARLLGLLDDRR